MPRSGLRVVRGSVGPEAPPLLRAQPNSHFEFVPRDSEKSEFLDLVDFGDVAFSAETFIFRNFVWRAAASGLKLLVSVSLY